MKKQNRDIIIWILGMLVIAQSLWIVWKIDGMKKVTGGQILKQVQDDVAMLVKKPVAEKAEANFMIKGDSEAILGKIAKVSLSLTPMVSKNIDSLEVYVSYDPMLMEVNPKSLSFGAGLPRPTFSQVSKAKGVIVANILIAQKEGLKLLSGKEMPVLSFEYRALNKGMANLSLTSPTMMVETATVKLIPFASNTLSVSIK